MFSVFDIARRDAATYYMYGTNDRVSRTKTLFAFAGLSTAVGFLVGTGSNDFLAGALSAQAILVGFSFNVLFYLVANRLTAPSKFSGIEHELRFERLSKLSDEVFDNVTYFNLVAIFSAITALMLLLVASDSLNNNLHKIAILIVSHTKVTQEFLSWSKWAALSIGLSVLVFLLTESVYTFLRSVGRVRFYFSMLKTMNDDVEV